jgi:hypothetical protein
MQQTTSCLFWRETKASLQFYSSQQSYCRYCARELVGRLRLNSPLSNKYSFPNCHRWSSARPHHEPSRKRLAAAYFRPRDSYPSAGSLSWPGCCWKGCVGGGGGHGWLAGATSLDFDLHCVIICGGKVSPSLFHVARIILSLTVANY